MTLEWLAAFGFQRVLFSKPYPLLFSKLSCKPFYLYRMLTAPAPTLVFENAAGRIEADPTGFMRSCWAPGSRTLADTQAFLHGLSQEIRRHGYPYVLINQVEMTSLTPEEQAWIAQEWLPAAVREAGYRAGAVVLATDIYSRLATAFVTTNVHGLPIRYRSFDEEQAAIAWLLKQR